MIMVTGTKRSGTSMWMQILKAAGFEIIGASFLGKWEESIKDANPRGFYESKFRNGVWYATNPDPKTGAFIPPKGSRKHVVKVFIPGLIRSDLAYLHRTMATVRHWREYTRSLKRLHDMEDVWLANAGDDPDTGESRLERARRFRSKLPPPIEWWFENYDLIRDVATRRYPFHAITYEKVLEHPRENISRIVEWMGGGDVDAAVASIEPKLRTQRRAPQIEDDADIIPDGLDEESLSVFEEYYRSIHEDGKLASALVERMNKTQRRLEVRFPKPGRERRVR